MKYKKGLIFICLIICLFSIASVCASEVNGTVVTSEDQNDDVIEIDDENDNIFAVEEQDNDEVDATEEDELPSLEDIIKDNNSKIKKNKEIKENNENKNEIINNGYYNINYLCG